MSAANRISPADPLSGARRNVWHDVRSVLAAACTNADYLVRMADLPESAQEVAREIENEMLLATDVIDLVTSERAPDQRVELDLRAVLWLLRPGSSRVLVDAAQPPFPVSGRFRCILAFADAITAAATPHGKMERVDPTRDDARRIGGLDPVAVAALVRAPFPGVDLALSMPEPGTLEMIGEHRAR
jgi:hypothetical protein